MVHNAALRRVGILAFSLISLVATGCAGSEIAALSKSAPGTAPGTPGENVADAAPSADACADASSTELTVANTYGELHGTLELPRGCGPFTAVVIAPGSGATDRDGNSVGSGLSPNIYRLIAKGLAERGIASLRYDKAGVGASSGASPARENDIRFEMGADDLARIVAQLRLDARLHHIAIMGHSEGALLGILAMKKSPADSYISAAGAGRPIGILLREQLTRNIQDQTLLATAISIIEKLERGETVPDVPQSLTSLFRASVQPYLISWMTYDPAKEIGQLSVPVLIIQGTTDIQVKVDDANALKAGKPDATLRIIDGMNHVLKEATLSAASQNRAYSDPTLPIAPLLFDAIEAFVPQN